MSKKFGVKTSEQSQITIGSNNENLVFGFSEVKPFSYTCCRNDSMFFISFLERLKKLCSLTWKTVAAPQRHSFGFEKIETKRLSTAARNHIPQGMDSLLVFRATGDNHVFLGYRDGNTFQIVFIEYNFGDVYAH